MNLAAPQMLWLLAVILPALIAFFWWAWRKRQQLITQFISARLLAHLKVGVSAARQKARMVLIVTVVALLIFALARPQWGFIQEEARQRGLDIIVAVDTSNSMLAQDVAPNRLTRAKLAALDLAQRARTDRLGLIAFAGSAFLECPPTLDDAAFSASVNSLDTRTISQGGTAIAGGIDEARRAFKKEPGNHKVLVLFTDGEDQDSDAVPAAKRAADDGVIILTVGVGTAEGDLLRIRDENGRQDYIRDDDGKPVKSHMNEELLQQIAQAGKGFYLPLRGTKTMDMLYDQGIAPLPKSEFSAKFFQHYRERFYWPLSLAMALLVVEMFLPDRKRRRSRSAAPAVEAASAAGPVTQIAALVLFLALPLVARAGNPSSALHEYNQGKFEDALKDYDQLLEKKSDDPRLHFNAGAAAYQSQKMTDAAREFNEAATNSANDLPLQQRAYYNEGNTYYRLGQQIQDPAKKQEAWENALQFYTNALVLNRQDPDAAFNREEAAATAAAAIQG
jgi:Ca-activated chloride channel family protein